MDTDVNERETIGANNPPPEEALALKLSVLDPENLLPVTPEELVLLLAQQYPAIEARRQELRDGIDRWMDLHRTGTRIVITDDADNNTTADFLRQLSTFIGPKGDVQDVFEKVKGPIFKAAKVVDGWKSGKIDDIARDYKAMDAAQLVYMKEKAERERQAREEQARQEREAAAKAEREAREAIAREEEAQRLAAAGTLNQGVAEAATRQADFALKEAELAAKRAETVEASANASLRDMARSRSALGVTSTLVDNWTAEVVDIKALCAAVAAGTVPAQFVMANESVIRAAVKAKQSPLRECPGLKIENQQTARRTGG